MLYKRYTKRLKKESDTDILTARQKNKRIESSPEKYSTGTQKMIYPTGSEPQNGWQWGENGTGKVVGAGATTAVGMIASNMKTTDQNGNIDTQKSEFQGVLGGAAMGASMGSVAGPWGMAAGAIVGGVAGGITAGNKAAKAKQAEVEAKREEQRLADLRKFSGVETGYIEPTTTNTFGRTLYGDMNATQIYAKNGVRMGTKKYNDGVYKMTADFAEGNLHEDGGIKYMASIPTEGGMKKKPVEVERGELELTDIEGNKTIIPRKFAKKTKDFLAKGNNLAVQTIIDTLPSEEEATIPIEGALPSFANGGEISPYNWQKPVGPLDKKDPYKGLPERGYTTIEGIVDEEGNPVKFETLNGEIAPDLETMEYYNEYLQSQGMSPEEAQAKIQTLGDAALQADEAYNAAYEQEFKQKQQKAISSGGGSFTMSDGTNFETDAEGNSVENGVAMKTYYGPDGTELGKQAVSTEENPSLYDPTSKYSEFDERFSNPEMANFINNNRQGIIKAADSGEGFGALQRMMNEENAKREGEGLEPLNPDEFSNYFDELYSTEAVNGVGITGKRGHGEGSVQNLEDMNLSALRRQQEDINAANAEKKAIADEYNRNQTEPATPLTPGIAGEDVPLTDKDKVAQAISTEKQSGFNVGEALSTVGSAAPTLYNLGKGLFDRADIYDADLIDLEKQQYTDMSDPRRQAIRGDAQLAASTIYGFNPANQKQNARLAKLQAQQNLTGVDLGELARHDQIAAQNVQTENYERQFNLGQQEKADAKTVAAAANKTDYLEAGLGGLGTLSDDLYTRSLVKKRDTKADAIQGTTLGTMQKTMPFLYDDKGGLDPNAVAEYKKILGLD